MPKSEGVTPKIVDRRPTLLPYPPLRGGLPKAHKSAHKAYKFKPIDQCYTQTFFFNMEGLLTIHKIGGNTKEIRISIVYSSGIFDTIESFE